MTGIPFAQTFLASIRSVGSAFTLAAVGVYLHRRGIVEKSATKILAKISQQVTLPLLFFTAVVQCSQNMSHAPCPNMAAILPQTWVLLLWPAYVVGWGLIVGYLMALVSQTPRSQIRSVLAACAFANSTGMPITLFTVLRANFPTTANMGTVNPNLFLSVYLLTYPILQWGVGGWLLQQPEEQQEVLPQCQVDGNIEDGRLLKDTSTRVSSLTLTETSSLVTPARKLEDDDDGDMLEQPHGFQELCLKACSFLQGVGVQLLQPPVLGAAVGFLVAAIPPLRGIFVDTYDRNSSAPLQWAFDALYNVGQAAVPINMIILGINLSNSQWNFAKSTNGDAKVFSRKTMLSIVIGKMILMPLIGFVSVIVFDKVLWHASTSPHASLCLVAMMVFITPTANNVMVMVELAGGSKEGIAQAIAWQYAAAPLLLSLNVTLMLGAVYQWA